MCSASAVLAGGRLLFRFTFFRGEREELATIPAGSDLKIGNSVLVNVGRQEEFKRIKAEDDAVGELDEGQAIVEHFKGCFLPLSFRDMSHHKYGLSFPFNAQVP